MQLSCSSITTSAHTLLKFNVPGSFAWQQLNLQGAHSCQTGGQEQIRSNQREPCNVACSLSKRKGNTAPAQCFGTPFRADLSVSVKGWSSSCCVPGKTGFSADRETEFIKLQLWLITALAKWAYKDGAQHLYIFSSGCAGVRINRGIFTILAAELGWISSWAFVRGSAAADGETVPYQSLKSLLESQKSNYLAGGEERLLPQLSADYSSCRMSMTSCLPDYGTNWGFLLTDIFPGMRESLVLHHTFRYRSVMPLNKTAEQRN